MIRIALTDCEIADCYPIMSQLRPHITEADFVPFVRRLMESSGFRLVYLDDGKIRAVGGFRVSEWLAGGKYLEIEDLVTEPNVRSKGYGSMLFDWFVTFARSEKCSQLRLVSHVARYDAHRFYLRKRMIIEAHYFSMKL